MKPKRRPQPGEPRALLQRLAADIERARAVERHEPLVRIMSAWLGDAKHALRLVIEEDLDRRAARAAGFRAG